ncbi:hypothetical protein K432DRAFT_433675 [Lepidopterella palustris CBS 459.81]|uniref:RRM Nup35-type domain-containing protein n=1 Tax=Lepidopterella palustris CBS 459.81 TaxID=1314670 RepID=A0A8E2EE81_9PEZI|nr:hypothetical protein K432DRAFT_433675 [Lepidopterella palustris CBS 459.81]
MQVHAVPDAERAFDSTGRQLPWGYEYADSDLNHRRLPEEKGPFGKATRRRGMSRSKTTTPAARKEEDQTKLENLKVMDDIFTSYKQNQELKAKESLRVRKPSGTAGGLPLSASVPNLEAAAAPASTQPTTAKEPTEVILYGFGSEIQWAAIEYFERVSYGQIYEDYDRHPPTSKYNLSLSLSRASAQRNISQVALRKKNEYVGGLHWIKVTFDSPEAAERACHYSPHTIHGYTVYAERYRGTGPSSDVPIPANRGPMSSQTTSPNPTSSHTLPAETASSETASSATATASVPISLQQRHSEPRVPASFPGSSQDIRSRDGTSSSSVTVTGSQFEKPRQATLRIPGAKLAVLLPAEQAFLPAAPRWQQTLGSWPIIGWIFGSGHEFIGNQVPRKEDGSFDYENASVYWKFWNMIDSCLGTDFCGVRGDDDE